MDDLDRCCAQALRERRVAYNTWRRNPSPQTDAAYTAACESWRQAVAPQAARQQAWQARRRGTLLAALKQAVRPAGRKVMAPQQYALTSTSIPLLHGAGLRLSPVEMQPDPIPRPTGVASPHRWPADR